MKTSRRHPFVSLVIATVFLLQVRSGAAVEVAAPYVELPVCDDHHIALSHELGNPPVVPFGPEGPFPADEAIASDVMLHNFVECSAGLVDPGAPDFLVKITNLTASKWTDLFFVADPEYAYNNHDGIILDGLAMKIDTIGLNTPLVFESITADLVFEPGETWVFEVLDWSAPDPPHLFGSIGVGGASALLPGSTASIVANLVPLPPAVLLFGCVAALLPIVGKRRLNRDRQA